MDNPSIRAAVIAAALFLGTLSAAADEVRRCDRIATPQLANSWIFSVARTNSSILAVDSPRRHIVEISPTGSIATIFGGLEGGEQQATFLPVLLQSIGKERFVLGNGVRELLEVIPGSTQSDHRGAAPAERNLRVTTMPKLTSAMKGNQSQIIGLFNWGLTKHDHVLAFADIAHHDGTFTRGLVWFERSRPEVFRLVREVEKKSAEATFYFVFHPFVATVKHKAYFLAMGAKPTIYEFDGSRLRSLGLPREFRNPPFVPDKEGPRTIPEIYAELEHATTPVGLYAWRDDLWLLGRRPLIEGGTHWTLSRIRPTNDKPGYASKLLYTLHLPTTSEHLALAVGDHYWTVLEKRSVVEMGLQPIDSMFRLPASWIENRKGSALSRLDLSVCR